MVSKVSSGYNFPPLGENLGLEILVVGLTTLDEMEGIKGILHHYSFGGFGFKLPQTFCSHRIEDADDFMAVYTSFLKKKKIEKEKWDRSSFHPMTLPHSFSLLLEFLRGQLKSKSNKKTLARLEKVIEATKVQDPKIRVISNDKSIFVIEDSTAWYIYGSDGGREVIVSSLPRKRDREVLNLLTKKVGIIVSSIHFEALGRCITYLPGDDSDSESS